jgi:hypothetical protein
LGKTPATQDQSREIARRWNQKKVTPWNFGNHFKPIWRSCLVNQAVAARRRFDCGRKSVAWAPQPQINYTKPEI